MLLCKDEQFLISGRNWFDARCIFPQLTSQIRQTFHVRIDSFPVCFLEERLYFFFMGRLIPYPTLFRFFNQSLIL